MRAIRDPSNSFGSGARRFGGGRLRIRMGQLLAIIRDLVAWLRHHRITPRTADTAAVLCAETLNVDAFARRHSLYFFLRALIKADAEILVAFVRNRESCRGNGSR